MKIAFVIMTLVSLILGACATQPDPGAIQTAIAQTKVAEPTETTIPSPTSVPSPTLIPLSKLNLEELLFIKGDLPADYILGQIKNTPPVEINIQLPSSVNLVRQDIQKKPYISDGITIALYESVSDIQDVYKIFTKAMSEEDFDTIKNVNDVGENALITNAQGSPSSVRLVFSRCHAIIYISLFSIGANEETVITYGKRVDIRISPLVCGGVQ